MNDLLGIMSYALLVDPVRIRGENTPGAYERAEITKWLSQPNGGRSPSTNQVASVDDLIPASSPLCSLIIWYLKFFLSNHFKYILLSISAQSWLSVPPAPA